MTDSIMVWFIYVLGGDFLTSLPEELQPFLLGLVMAFSGIAVLLTLAFVFKFILKLVER